MARRERPPFSNGMCEEEVIAHLRNNMPYKPNPGGEAQETIYSPKWSEGDKHLRQQLILYWITKLGYTRLECVQLLMQEFGISRSNGYAWVKDALDLLNEGFEEYVDYARQVMIEKIEKSIKECKAAGKLKEAAMFTEQLNKIYGLYKETKSIEVNTDGPIKFQFDK